MAEPRSHHIPGLAPSIAVAPGASLTDLIHGAHGLLIGALDILARDDLTQEQWTALSAIGLARAFIAQATEVDHG